MAGRKAKPESRTNGKPEVTPDGIKVSVVPLSDFVPDSANTRKHGDKNKRTIRASLKQFGGGRSIVADGNNVVRAGNGTLEQALAEGMRAIVIDPEPDQLVVVRRKDWTPTQAVAYGVQDNRSAMLGEDDPLAIAEIVTSLRGENFPIEALGYDDDEADELEGLLASPDVGDQGAQDVEDSDPQIDGAAEFQSRWQVKPGDVWVIPSTAGGEHRLMCGDSTKADDVGRLMAGERASICFTSPPYGQQRDYKNKVADWDVLMRGVFGNLPMADDGQVLVNLGLIHREGEWVPYWDGWIAWMRGQGWRRFGWYVWDQGPGMPGDWNGRLAPSHEFIFHFNRVAEKPRKTVPCKDAGKLYGEFRMRGKDGVLPARGDNFEPVQDTRIPDTVFRVTRHKFHGIESAHPAVFPPSLAVEVIEAFSDPGEVAYEPFCGSGTSIVAAERCRRLCYAMEIAPEYCAVALERLAGMGLEPRRS